MLERQIHSYRYQLLSLPFLLILCLCYNLKAQIADPDPERFNKEIERFKQWDKKNSYLEDKILFVGSSSIRFWSSAISFPNLYIINRGFGGAHISDVNFFYEQIVKKYKPAKIVFYAGGNDIAAGKSADQVVEDYQNFVEKIEKDLPETLVFYLPSKPSLSRWQFWPQAMVVNSKIKLFIEAKAKLFYVDTISPMLNEKGEPKPDIYIDDGLHMNEMGYQLWKNVLLPYLR
jgi:lysophospholipase L1-like esterase